MRTSIRAGVTTAALAAASLTAAGPAVAADKDCPDFKSQAQAQAVYDADPSDPNRLDRDGDGQACETYDYKGSSQSDGGNASDNTSSSDTGDSSSAPSGGVDAGGGGTAPGQGNTGPASLALLGGLLAAGGGTVLIRRRKTN